MCVCVCVHVCVHVCVRVLACVAEWLSSYALGLTTPEL